MSKEREILRKIVDYMWEGELVDEIKELLAQPEQEQEVLKKDWVNFGYTAGRKEGYNRGYAIAREDYKQKVINAFGVDDEC
jgi:hypothetical protein